MTKQEQRNNERTERCAKALKAAGDQAYEALGMNQERFPTNKQYDAFIAQWIMPVFKKQRVNDGCIFAQLALEEFAKHCAPKNSIKRRTAWSQMFAKRNKS